MPEQRQNLYSASAKIKLTLIGILYPGWSILLLIALPNEYNSILGRTIVGLFSFLCLWGIYKFPALASRSALVVDAVIMVATIHFIIVTYLSGLSYIYIIGMLVYTTAVSGLFESKKSYFAFSLLYIGGTAIVCFFTSPSKETVVMLMAGLVTLATVFIAILIAKENLENEIAQNRKALESSRYFASLGQFAAGVAHEINNPLAVIMGNADIMKSKIASGSLEDVHNLTIRLEKIINMSKRASSITGSLLTFKGSQKPFQTQAVSPDLFIGNLKEMSKEFLENTDVDLRIEIDESLQSIPCCESDIVTAVLNIVKNAIYYASQKPNGSVRVSITNSNEYIFFTVTDSGPGIPLPLVDKIFQPFFTTKAVGEGKGLGLAEAYGLISKAQGTLVYDTKQTLTTFVASIPKTLAS